MCKTNHASLYLLIMSELLFSLPAYFSLLIQQHLNSWMNLHKDIMQTPDKDSTVKGSGIKGK
jgi:TorA maturation chaperone TorD